MRLQAQPQPLLREPTAPTADGEATTTAPEVDPYEPEQENFGDANGSNPVSMRAEIAIPVYEAIARISWTSSSPK